jgi:hypothetical protein
MSTNGIRADVRIRTHPRESRFERRSPYVSDCISFELIISADHVDILGATPLNEAILKIAAGRGDLVKDKIESGILEYVEKMNWE